MPRSKTVNDIQRKCYAMKFGEEDNAEITMYGEIVESQPVDWWTGEKIDGEYIIQSEFLSDLESVINVGVKSVTFRMSSIGGDAEVSVLIHNRIRELANNGVATTCIIDGVAESGGSLIACACDKVVVYPSSMFMMHKCWGVVWGGYNADDLRSLATSLDATDKQQIAIYKAKSGKSETVISHAMSSTTFLVGQQIIDEGYADEMTDSSNDIQIAASADKRFIFANGHRLPIPRGMVLPDFISTVATSKEEPIKSKKSADDTDTKPKEETTMATNFSELRTENPELAVTVEQEIRSAVSAENNNAVAAAVEAERQRLADIDEIAGLFDADLVHEAKYDKPCSRAELAERAAVAAAKQGRSFISALEADTKASGVDNVAECPAPDDGKTGAEDKKASAKAAVESWKKIKEGKVNG